MTIEQIEFDMSTLDLIAYWVKLALEYEALCQCCIVARDFVEARSLAIAASQCRTAVKSLTR